MSDEFDDMSGSKFFVNMIHTQTRELMKISNQIGAIRMEIHYLHKRIADYMTNLSEDAVARPDFIRDIEKSFNTIIRSLEIKKND